jgi:RNA polymerase sigma factor (sigma-70 family)
MTTRSSSLPGLLERVLSDAQAPFSDQQLLDRFVESGDETAFAAILDRHGPMLLGVSRRLLGDAHLADDVLQATFLVLARKARAIRRRDNLAGWLYGVTRRLARQAQLAEAARSRRERKTAGLRGQTRERDGGWDELLRVLDEELQRLPERVRAPLLLCYLEGRTQDEAARQLGWSLSTLRRRLEHGRELLRTRMARRGATLGAGLVAGLLAPAVVRAVLTDTLRQAVLKVASGGKASGVSPSVLVLANGGMGMTTRVKVLFWSALAVTMAGVLVGMNWQTRPAPDAEEPPAVAQPAEQADVRPDRADEPLPRGAVARLGSMAFRHGALGWYESLTFTPDGKHLISTGNGWIRRWDLATGHALVNLGDGGRHSGPQIGGITADGKIARICFCVLTGPFSNMQCTEYDLENGKERRTYRIDAPSPANSSGTQVPNLFSPDGKTFADFNREGAMLWNAPDGTFTHHLMPHGGACTTMAFSPDSKSVLVGGEGHKIHVYDRTTGKEERSFGLPEGNLVANMAISPDGKWLVTAGGQKGNNPPIWPRDRFVRLWNLQEGTVARTIEFPEDQGVRSLAFTPDSGTLIAGLSGFKSGSPSAVRAWDVASGKPGRAWTDDPTIGLTVAVSPDGKVLATMNRNGVIRLWDMATGQERNPVEASPCAQESVSFQADGKTVVTVGLDHALRTWDTTTGKLLGTPRILMQSEQANLIPPAWLVKRRLVATGKLVQSVFSREDRSSVYQLHDAATGKLLLEREARWLVVSPDGKRLALLTGDHHLRILDLETGKEIQAIALPEEERSPNWNDPLPHGFGPEGQSLIVQGERLSAWDVQTGKRKTSWSLLEQKVLTKPPDKTGRSQSWERIECFAASPDGSQVAFGVLADRPEKGTMRPWISRVLVLETATGKPVHEADVEDDAVEVIAFSPDGKRLAGGGRWTVRVWDMGAGKAARVFEGHRGRVRDLAFSPDGKRLASASEDSSVLIWEVAP